MRLSAGSDICNSDPIVVALLGFESGVDDRCRSHEACDGKGDVKYKIIAAYLGLEPHLLFEIYTYL